MAKTGRMRRGIGPVFEIRKAQGVAGVPAIPCAFVCGTIHTRLRQLDTTIVLNPSVAFAALKM